MAERRSSQHSPRIDEALESETESLTRGAPVESRADEARRAEEPGDDEPFPDARISGYRGLREPSPDAAEVEQRSELAATLRGATFPARREELVRAARQNHAPDALVASLESLPAGRDFLNVQQVWEAVEEQRAG